MRSSTERDSDTFKSGISTCAFPLKRVSRATRGKGPESDRQSFQPLPAAGFPRAVVAKSSERPSAARATSVPQLLESLLIAQRVPLPPKLSQPAKLAGRAFCRAQ